MSVSVGVGVGVGVEKKLSILFISDSLKNFNLLKDTTYVLIKEAARRGFEIAWSDITGLYADREGPKALAKIIEIINLEDQNTRLWFKEKKSVDKFLTDFDFVFMRKDPPFNMNYIYATYLLDLADALGVRVINAPKAIRDHNEKLSILKFKNLIPETLVGSEINLLKNFIKIQKACVLKPLDGMGGAGIFKLNDQDPNLSVILESATQLGVTPVMLQAYIPDILKTGDRRIILIDGAPIPYGLARMPSKGEFRGNLAAGGVGHVFKLSEQEINMAKTVGDVLKKQGLFFVGLDTIGGLLTEINVTSPTCLQEIQNETRVNWAEKIWNILLGGDSSSELSL